MFVEVLKNEPLNLEYGNNKFYYLLLKNEEIASEKEAGRFIMIAPTSSSSVTDPLLQRPFAIAETFPDEGTFSCIYMVVGMGTMELTKAKAGERLRIKGPLGNSFSFQGQKNVALIAGGIGIAPMINAALFLKKQGQKVTLYYGGRSRRDILLLDYLSTITDNLFISTDDGSYATHGNVCTSLKDKIATYDKLYACGPNRMLEAVYLLAKEYGKPLDVSLDTQMACGVGACLGCMVVLDMNGQKVRKRCCKEGPIFDAYTLDFKELLK